VSTFRGPRGAGSVDQLSDGSWRFRRSTSIDGRRRTVTTYHATLDDARLAQRLARPVVASDVITFGEWAARWLASQRQQLIPYGRENYFSVLESHLRLYLMPAWATLPLAKIRPHDCDDLWMALLSRPLARKTVTQTRSVAKLIFRSAERAELLYRNVANLSELPKLHRGDHSHDRAAKAAARAL